MDTVVVTVIKHGPHEDNFGHFLQENEHCTEKRSFTIIINVKGYFTCIRLNLEMWDIGASQIPCGSGVTRAGHRKNANTRSTQIALISLVSVRFAVRRTS